MSNLPGWTDTGMCRAHSVSTLVGPTLEEDDLYFVEIRPAVIASLGATLARDPLADVVTLVSREGDTSLVTTVPRLQAVEHFRRSGNRMLLAIAERIASLPSSPAARWVVMVTPEFSTSTSVVLVQSNAPASELRAEHPGREVPS